MAKIKAEYYEGGVPVNPVLPKMFDSTPNEARPKSHQKFWNVPFIVLAAYPSGTRYDVRCLDGGAWDRSTWWGSFDNINDAVKMAGGNNG